MYFARVSRHRPGRALTPSFTYGSRVDVDGLQAFPKYYVSIASFTHTVNFQDVPFF